MWNGYPIQKSSGTEVEIIDEKININPGSQKVLTDTSNIPQKKLNDKDREIFNNIIGSLGFENHKALRGESKSGSEKIIVPSNIIDIYTRLKVFLGSNSQAITIFSQKLVI